jgi:hypothetical protein
MPCQRDNDRCRDNEVIVGNTVFEYNLRQLDQNTFDLSVTPCNNPTAVYCIARITTRENCCNNMKYYQSFINTDPVQIIQDCSLCEIIRRSIAVYFENLDQMNTSSSCGCSRRNSFGLF